jgi:hypothetical protein
MQLHCERSTIWRWQVTSAMEGRRWRWSPVCREVEVAYVQSGILVSSIWGVLLEPTLIAHLVEAAVCQHFAVGHKSATLARNTSRGALAQRRPDLGPPEIVPSAVPTSEVTAAVPRFVRHRPVGRTFATHARKCLLLATGARPEYCLCSWSEPGAASRKGRFLSLHCRRLYISWTCGSHAVVVNGGDVDSGAGTLAVTPW